MNIANLIDTMPKSASRASDFVNYQSKSGFMADCKTIAAAAKTAINTLPNVFTIAAHNSGKYAAVTLYFGGANIEKADRYKFVMVDCEKAASGGDCASTHATIAATKTAIRAALAASDTTSQPQAEKPASDTPAAANDKPAASTTEKPASQPQAAKNDKREKPQASGKKTA